MLMIAWFVRRRNLGGIPLGKPVLLYKFHLNFE
jgi:hypothetical protein